MDMKFHWKVPIIDRSVSPKSDKSVDEKLFDAKAIQSCAISLEPITPDSNRGAVEFPVDMKSSQILINDCSPKKEYIVCLSPHPTSSNSPLTPVDGVFDSFAPGPEELLNAPRCMKLRSDSQINVVRRLNFDLTSLDCFRIKGCVDDAIAAPPDEEMLLEIVYEDLLEAIIVSKQREGLLLDDDCKTPNSAKRLSDVAETCPQAPVKYCSIKSRNIDRSLCRRLDF